MSNQSFSISGKVVWVGELKLMGEKQFPVREFAIECPSKFKPQTPCFQVTRELAQDFPYSEGDEIDVLFNVEGRSYQGKYFTRLAAWRIRDIAGGQKPGKPAPADRAAQPAEDEMPPW